MTFYMSKKNNVIYLEPQKIINNRKKNRGLKSPNKN